MKNLNSDQLRAQLHENNAAMNTLAEDNQKIVELLAERGLQAVEPDNNDVAIHPCVMQLDKLGEALFRTQFEPKRREEIALTTEELKAGGWWCADVSEACRLAFVEKGLDPWSKPWSGETEFARCYLAGTIVLRSTAVMAGLKQIHRIGNNFYWGAASDQAN